MALIANEQNSRTLSTIAQFVEKTFSLLMLLVIRVLRNFQEHMKQNGCVPRQHGNVGRLPANTIPFEATQQAVRFIHNFALVHGLPQPAAPRGRADTAPTYLPASENFRSVHAKYVEACGKGVLAGGGVGTSATQTSSQRVLKYRSFVSLWHTAFPDKVFDSSDRRLPHL